MWPITPLAHIVTLLQEQNLLLRELIEALTRKAPRTIPSGISAPTPQNSRAKPAVAPIRSYTGADVVVVTQAMREELAIKEWEKQERPWRVMDLPQEAQAAMIATMNEEMIDHRRPPPPPIPPPSPVPLGPPTGSPTAEPAPDTSSGLSLRRRRPAAEK